ncbi:MAG: hypothetical protein ACTSPY_05220 [Candidatus Helarchaeota archaeon]
MATPITGFGAEYNQGILTVHTANLDHANNFISIFKLYLDILSVKIIELSNCVKIIMKIDFIDYTELKKMIIEKNLPTMGECIDENGNKYSLWTYDLLNDNK